MRQETNWPNSASTALPVLVLFEHERAVCPVGEQDADDVVQNVADARRKRRAKRCLKRRKDNKVQQRGQPAEEQVGQPLIIFFLIKSLSFCMMYRLRLKKGPACYDRQAPYGCSS